MLKRLLKGPLLLTLWLLAGTAQAYAATPEQLEGYQEAVRSQLDVLITSSLNDFFRRSGRDLPGPIGVASKADFDLSSGEPRLTKVHLSVTINAEQAAQVGREARQQIARTLRGNGYRFGAAATTAEERMPEVKLEVTASANGLDGHGGNLRAYATFAALVGMFLACLVLAVAIVLRPFTRRSALKRRQAQTLALESGPSAAGGGSSRHDWPQVDPVPDPRDWPSSGLPPLPRPSPLAAGALPPLATGAINSSAATSRLSPLAAGSLNSLPAGSPSSPLAAGSLPAVPSVRPRASAARPPGSPMPLPPLPPLHASAFPGSRPSPAAPAGPPAKAADRNQLGLPPHADKHLV